MFDRTPCCGPVVVVLLAVALACAIFGCARSGTNESSMFHYATPCDKYAIDLAEYYTIVRDVGRAERYGVSGKLRLGMSEKEAKEAIKPSMMDKPDGSVVLPSLLFVSSDIVWWRVGVAVVHTLGESKHMGMELIDIKFTNGHLSSVWLYSTGPFVSWTRILGSGSHDVQAISEPNDRAFNLVFEPIIGGDFAVDVSLFKSIQWWNLKAFDSAPDVVAIGIKRGHYRDNVLRSLEFKEKNHALDAKVSDRTVGGSGWMRIEYDLEVNGVYYSGVCDVEFKDSRVYGVWFRFGKILHHSPYWIRLSGSGLHAGAAHVFDDLIKTE